ncbi:MAG: septation protein A [Alphaproteobacteria bacterium]|nr:septation protein A [Alphaproteobacteria bacterium]
MIHRNPGNPAFMKFLLDFGPLAAFFTLYKLYGLMPATAGLIAATLVSLAITYIREKKLALAPLITALVVAFFGGLTLWLDDDRFIKMKPTIINLAFALILWGGLLRGKALLKLIMGHALTLPDAAWRTLSRRWAWFFAAVAVLNEIAWRTLSTDMWVNFKVFGLIGLIFLFSLAQMPFIQRHMEKTEG